MTRHCCSGSFNITFKRLNCPQTRKLERNLSVDSGRWYTACQDIAAISSDKLQNACIPLQLRISNVSNEQETARRLDTRTAPLCTHASFLRDRTQTGYRTYRTVSMLTSSFADTTLAKACAQFTNTKRPSLFFLCTLYFQRAPRVSAGGGAHLFVSPPPPLP